MMFAVTGTGAVSPLGVGTSTFIDAVRNGESAIRPLPAALGIAAGAKFEAPFVPDIEKKLAFLMDPASQYAVAAADEAMRMAGLSHLAPSRIGVIMGIGVCGIETIDAAYEELYARRGRISPFAIPKIMPSAPASSITMALGVQGPSFCTTSACASSTHAIINGALWLQTGQFLTYLASGRNEDPEVRREWSLAGARVLARACELVGHNSNIPYQCISAARILSGRGENDATLRWLQRVIAVVDDEKVRRLALDFLKAKLGEREQMRVAERLLRLERAWKQDLGFLPKDRMWVLDPAFDPWSCAGLQAQDKVNCAASWRDWSERNLPDDEAQL